MRGGERVERRRPGPARQGDPVTLDHDDLELLAERLAERLRDVLAAPAVRLVDATTVARMLAVDRDWVYAHAAELGAVRLGGPRGRVRFDVREVERSVNAATVRPPRRRALRPTAGRGSGENVELLPYKGSGPEA
jgi:hypothetical protein